MTARRERRQSRGRARRMPADARARRGAVRLAAKPVTVADLLAGLARRGLARARPRGHAVLELPHGRVVIELASRAAPQHAANIKRAGARALLRWSRDHPRAGQLRRAVGRSRATTVPCRPACAPSVEFTADCARRGALRAPAGSRSLCAAGRISRRLSRRRAIRARTRVARALLRHGGRRPRRSAGEHGTEMYAVIGHAPRQLDRNVALVGRVLKGMELLSTPAARQRRDGLLRRHRNRRCPSLGADRRGRAASRSARRSRCCARTARRSASVLEQRRERHEPWFKYNPGAHRSLQRAAAGTRDPRPRPLSSGKARRARRRIEAPAAGFAIT